MGALIAATLVVGVLVWIALHQAQKHEWDHRPVVRNFDPPPDIQALKDLYNRRIIKNGDTENGQ